MTDINREALASAWEEFEICATPQGNTGDLDLYDVDGMQDHAFIIYSIALAQAASIEELEKKCKAACTLADQYAKERDTFMEQSSTARNDALREAALLCTVEADQYIERDEFKSAYSANQCAKAILELTTKETQ